MEKERERREKKIVRLRERLAGLEAQPLEDLL
jgi:hypothetical protein